MIGPSMKTIILAGGFARRLLPLTSDKAKPLLPLAGKPVISHIVDRLPKTQAIIVSTNEVFAEDFHAWRTTYPDRDITIFVEPAVTEEKKTGALGAVALALDAHAIEEDVLLIGGDNFYTFDIQEFLNFTDGAPALAVYDLGNLEQASKYGIVITEGKRVLDFEEKPQQPRSTLAGTCCYFFPRTVLGEVRAAATAMPDRLGGVFEWFLQKNIETHAFAFQGYWNDIGSFEAYVEAHVWAGGHLSVPDGLQDPALGNTFEGVNYIEEGCDIRGTHLKNSIVLSGSQIRGCRVDTSIIDRGVLEGCEVEGRIVKEGMPA